MSTVSLFDLFRSRPPIAGGAPDDDEPGTPEGNSPETGTDDVDWQKRYTDTQAEYTRQQQALKDADIWDDEQAVLARIAEKYPHLMADEDSDVDDDDDDDDVTFDDDDPRITEHEKRLAAAEEFMQQQAQEEANRLFDRHLGEEIGVDDAGKPKRTLSRQAREWIFAETIRLGDGRENLKKAYKEWVEFEDGLGEQYFERVKKSKKAPHVQANGQTATGTKPIEDMTRAEHNAWMVQRAQELEHK